MSILATNKSVHWNIRCVFQQIRPHDHWSRRHTHPFRFLSKRVRARSLIALMMFTHSCSPLQFGSLSFCSVRSGLVRSGSTLCGNEKQHSTAQSVSACLSCACVKVARNEGWRSIQCLSAPVHSPPPTASVSENLHIHINTSTRIHKHTHALRISALPYLCLSACRLQRCAVCEYLLISAHSKHSRQLMPFSIYKQTYTTTRPKIETLENHYCCHHHCLDLTFIVRLHFISATIKRPGAHPYQYGAHQPGIYPSIYNIIG